MSISSREELKSDQKIHFIVSTFDVNKPIQDLVKIKFMQWFVQSFNQNTYLEKFISYEEAHKDVHRQLNDADICQNPHYRFLIFKIMKDIGDISPLVAKDIYSIYPVYQNHSLHIDSVAKEFKITEKEAHNQLKKMEKEGILNQYHTIQHLREQFLFGLYDKKPQDAQQEKTFSKDSTIPISSLGLFNNEKPEKKFSLTNVSRDEIYEKKLIGEIFKYLG